MKKGKYAKHGFAAKALILGLALVTLMGTAVGGTLAWLMDDTDPVVNTFTDSNITIDLDETTTTYKMIPGWTIAKDPYVTVEANSEDCWLFVKVTESDDPVLADYIQYNVDVDAVSTAKKTVGEEELDVTHGGWTQGNGTDVPANVYYRKVAAANTNQYFAVLGSGTYTADEVAYTWADDEVLVKPEVTEQDMDAIAGDADQPSLTFKAYAVQLFKTNDNGSAEDTSDEFTAKEAWTKALAMETENT